MFDVQAFLRNLPHLPGVYRMLGAEGEILYVGKARDLKKRVSSYFQKTDHSERIRRMVAQISAVETTVTRSESEALLLENNLIKALTPRYNILFRDDKSYPYLVLSGHEFPRLAFHRGALSKQHRYFGPFPNAGAVRESIQLLQKVFRLRTCEDTVFQNRSRPCLLYQIKRCTAPCVGVVTAHDYAEDVQNAAWFLEGKENQVLDGLSAKMQEAAAAQRYELAAYYRDQIQSLSKIKESQFVDRASGRDADIIGLSMAEGAACVNLVMIRGGRHLGDKSFFPRNAEACDGVATIEAFLAQHYLAGQIPPEIILGEQVDAAALENLLSEHAGHRLRLTVHPTRERRVWLRMAEENARLALSQRLGQRSTQEARLAALREVLALPELMRIECFDVSHTMGEATVASCVVYDQLAMQNGQYRRYNMKAVTGGDDLAAMREALARRYRKWAEGEGPMPDLVLIDGGKGQVRVAADLMADLGLGNVALVGVAKGEGRKPGLEQLVFADERKPLQLAPNHPALLLIQQIRDEAHRFAISGHRARRAKARVSSSLEDIEGVGAVRRQKLLSRFGGLGGVQAASVDDLAQVEGISRKLAEKIYDELH
ncbi:MAG: excinuclease ABC subunit UvrC [Betaproteobacteria bacterium]|nr:excinuclease ABC subunit UvrC [Betaproteobacteria bacterium]